MCHCCGNQSKPKETIKINSEERTSKSFINKFKNNFRKKGNVRESEANKSV